MQFNRFNNNQLLQHRHFKQQLLLYRLYQLLHNKHTFNHNTSNLFNKLSLFSKLVQELDNNPLLYQPLYHNKLQWLNQLFTKTLKQELVLQSNTNQWHTNNLQQQPKLYLDRLFNRLQFNMFKLVKLFKVNIIYILLG